MEVDREAALADHEASPASPAGQSPQVAVEQRSPPKKGAPPEDGQIAAAHLLCCPRECSMRMLREVLPDGSAGACGVAAGALLPAQRQALSLPSAHLPATSHAALPAPLTPCASFRAQKLRLSCLRML